MPIFLRIPRLYPEMEEATVGRWIAREGDVIEAHQPIVEIITDKVSYEVEAPEGVETVVLFSTCAAEKSVLPVDSVLAVIGSPGEDPGSLPDWRAENRAVAAARRSALESPGKASPAGPSGPAAEAPPAGGPEPGIIRATPAARRAVRNAGISLEEVAATAAGGTVTETDVERYIVRKAGS